MTNEERKALVEGLRSNRPLPTLPHEAADQIEADGQLLVILDAHSKIARERIAELEAALQAIVPDYEELVRYADDTGAIRSWVEDAYARIAQANAALGGKQ